MNSKTSNHDIGIRKYEENNKVQYWLLVQAKPTDSEDDDKSLKVKFQTEHSCNFYFQVINSVLWKALIICLIYLDVTFFICYFWFMSSSHLLIIVFLMHLSCFFYWIDFLGAVIERVVKRHQIGERGRRVFFLIVDAVSLLPFSLVYILETKKLDFATLWQLRAVTLLRFYRIQLFFSNLLNSERNRWKYLIILYSSYMALVIMLHANFFLYRIDNYTSIHIKDWNASMEGQIITSLYYSVQMTLNVAFGDINPTGYTEILVNALAMAFGSSMTMGLFTGILVTSYVNTGKRRECYRNEYEATINILKERKTDKKLFETIRDNMQTLWKYKKGFTEHPPLHILPLALQKEIYFDINFGFLNRSIIFSSQPRSFLRSVSMFMKNVTYLPGEVIAEPLVASDAMICVASGVIEILSEENDESVLFSLTTGTILGEVNLFISIPNRCFIRASTYVEIQILKRVYLSRLALTYPSIYRTMRAEILERLQNTDELIKLEKNIGLLDSDFREIFRRKETKKFLRNLREYTKETMDESFHVPDILGLYVLSENIPRVKTLPINLIRRRPWILRPDTTLTAFWKYFTSLVIFAIVINHPIWTAFDRSLTPLMYVLLTATNIVFVVDLYFECTTAIEKKDHFTYITSIKDIVITKLKTLGFYLDILSTFYLSVYAELVWPNQVDFAQLLLSTNSLLKIWRLIAFIKAEEDNIKKNLLWFVTLKYIIAFVILSTWGASVLYLEACPGETCLSHRWFGQLEIQAVQKKDQIPCTTWPMTVSYYFATVIFFTLGFGDIVPGDETDCLIVTFCMIAGTTAMILCVSEISSAFKHLAVNSTTYQEGIFAATRFMTEHEIPKNLQKQVKNYLQLQWDYDKGYSLSQNSMTEVLPTIQKRIVTVALTRAFLTVPVFRKTNPDFVQYLVRLSKVRVLPPNEYIVQAGSFTREMYILENGFCQLTTEKENNFRVIGPLYSFGYYEMIKGIQQQLNIKTVTHAKIISLDYISYLKAITKYPSAKTEIDEILESEYKNPETLFASTSKSAEVAQNERKASLKRQAFFTKNFINVYKYHKSTNIKYWEPFRAWGKLRFLQFMILPFAIGPDSLFLKIWMSLRILNALIIATVAPIHFCFISGDMTVMIFLTTQQAFTAADVYLMFHVAYFNKSGLLMFHPAKMAVNYLKGTFLLDLVTAFPYFFLIDMMFPKGYVGFNIFLEIPGLLMILHLYKFFQGCNYLEKNILRKTDLIQVLKFIPLALILTNFITAVVILIECHELQKTGQPQFVGTNKLAIDYNENMAKFCESQNNNATREESGAFKIYLTTLYWVSSTMTGCGFGDLNPHSQSSMISAIVIISLGMFFYTYMFASISSRMVNTDVLISKHRNRIIWMSKFLKKKNVSTASQKKIFLHYQHEWQRAEGERPQKIFTNINATLRENIVASMYLATVHQVPVFENLEKIIIRAIGKNLDEIYFLAGDTIINYNDIQEYIYLIYRGQVNLFTKDGELKISMGRGGLFGNISNKQYSLSSEIVVAAENVDVLRMDSKLFFQILQVFPSASALVANLTATKKNYIKPKKEANDPSALSSIKLNLYNIYKIPMEYTAPVSSSKLRKEAFYLKNSIYKCRDKSLYAFLILPGSVLHDGIEICLFAMAYLSITLAIYNFAFQDISTYFLVISYVMDFMFAFEIYLQFHMSYFNKFGDCVISRKKIKKKYLSSKKIVYDILSNIPLDIIGFVAFYKYRTQLITTLRLNRILRFHFLFKFYQHKRRTLMINKIILQSCWILVMITLMIHFCACIWFIAVCPMGFYLEPTWVTEMGLKEKEKWELYIYSIYQVIIISASSGLGTLRIYSEQEIILNILFMLICRLCMVILASIMAAAINAQTQSLFFYQEQITELKATFKRQNISNYQLEKMWNYVKKLWTTEAGKQMPTFINRAPYAMKCKLMTEMFGSHLSQSYIFSETDAAFLRQLSIHLKRFVYFFGNYIVQQGDIDDTMYFIHKGKVSVLTIHPNLMETIHFQLTEKDSFGTRQGLIRGKPHDFSYRAETDVEILSLTFAQWNHLLKYFPEVEKEIYEKLKLLPSESPK